MFKFLTKSSEETQDALVEDLYDPTDESLQDSVNQNFWYGEEDIILVLLGLLKGRNLQLSKPKQGIVITANKTLFINKDFSFTLGYDLASTIYQFQTAAQGELLKSAIIDIFNWNKTYLQTAAKDNIISKHKILIPLNFSDSHWNTLEIIIQIDQVDNEFYLNRAITANVYESMNGVGLKEISTVHNFLEAVFVKLKGSENERFVFSGNKVNCKQQADNKSCGPITVHNIWWLLNGNEIEANSHHKYSDAEMLAMRVAHLEVIKLLDNPDDVEKISNIFISKQLQNSIKRDLEVVTNGQIEIIADKLYKYIDSKLSIAEQKSLFTNFDKYNEADLKTRELALMDNIEDAEEESQAIYKQESDSAEYLKNWFLRHYDDLFELKIVENIFKPLPKPRPKPLPELSWCNNGKDTLLALIPCLKYERQYAEAKRCRTQLFQFDSSVALQQTYHSGETIPGIGFKLSFNGYENSANKPFDGSIVALIGPRIARSHGRQLVYSGLLSKGNMQSVGKLYILDRMGNYLGFLEGTFHRGVLLQITKSTIADDKQQAAIFKHINTYCHDFRFSSTPLVEDLAFENVQESPILYSKIDKLNLDTYFQGEPLDAQNKPVKGLISCLIGKEMVGGFYLAYKGAIEDGEMHGFGTLTLYHPDPRIKCEVKILCQKPSTDKDWMSCIEHNIPLEFEEQILQLIEQQILAHGKEFLLNLDSLQFSKVKIKL